MLKRLCEEFGKHTLTEIKPRQVDGYLNRRRREGLAEATVNRYLRGLKTLFAVAKLLGVRRVVSSCRDQNPQGTGESSGGSHR